MSEKQQLKLELQRLYRDKLLGFSYTVPKAIKHTTKEYLSNDLKSLEESVSTCHLCNLSKSRKNVIFGDGNINADLMIISQSPSAFEDDTGKIFAGKAGELLIKMIENAIEIPKNSVYISNILKCRPPNTKTPEQLEIDSCKPYLLKQIEIIKPKVIFILGIEAYTHLTGDNTSLNHIRGKVYKFGSINLVPTFHPSYLLKNPSAKKEAFEDCLIIKELLVVNN